jgi:uracil-DNA glycosylase
MNQSLPKPEITFPANLLPDWKSKIGPISAEPYFLKLMEFLKSEHHSGKVIYPNSQNIFRAFETLDLPDVKVVIFGQDPYHGSGQATGYSFAVPNEFMPKPPSLKNIFKELESDLGMTLPKNQSDLSGWVGQGVLLLNTVLTVEDATPFSHRNQGWEQFTDQVIEVLNSRVDPIIFVLWGSHAQKLKSKIISPDHAVLESAHPSPLSAYRGFLGSKIFTKINEKLTEFGKKPINWLNVSSSSEKVKNHR